MPIPLHSGFDAKWTLYYALLRVGDAQSIAAAARSLAATDPQSAAEMSAASRLMVLFARSVPGAYAPG